MAQSRLNGHEQIKPNSLTSAEVDSTIALTSGANAFSGNLAMGGNRVTGAANASGANDLVTLGQLQAYLQGLSPLIAVQAFTTGAESFTIASGSVTQISGTTVDGVSPAVNDRILIKNAPAATGTGTADSSGQGTDQPANGVYTVTGNTTNLTLSRDSTSATPLATGVHPAGKFVYAEGGGQKGIGYIVIDPTTPDTTFTYGSTNMQWGKLNGSGSGSVTTVSVASANGFGGTVANASSTPAITVTTSVSGIAKGNGTALSAATSGTDYMAPGNFVANEAPSGSINGSNTSFTLANTPNSNVTNPVMLYLNGMLQQPGSGNDYTLSGTTITMLSAPATGDKLLANYFK